MITREQLDAAIRGAEENPLPAKTVVSGRITSVATWEDKQRGTWNCNYLGSELLVIEKPDGFLWAVRNDDDRQLNASACGLSKDVTRAKAACETLAVVYQEVLEVGKK